ncbi:putative mitochondrial distribution and morphology protein 34 protein [Phaeoacremonium minimum UCRPA7]|uniref:Putative mitochondrial distribution and morphology protein 34 protein n=1 Tax=Phaeoacremonium minimum (strain UCR-PA7) TaxID=1286976 RepID=R8BTP3_PHAM7|nr:putative mitochondrial distribution and morphology protein 34 protein [Phaeoacremonium minimum UCRPA7]EOO02736.1 putative mitochondrial distribution and morphology protein 34 protein [Phaeoacremonium minimum UCRPA7]
MAFNFNWSPLTADADFYKRARDLLTAALNKSPKPPIIVDDILVTEFNLGSVPPDLEILEIGDLAEDRFRGIFKMCYSGDAFLTLRTRVQQKGLTIVFRNDPLESLKVSSTFDSIPFVRDYLQRTIEGKLRDLMMDELPAIIHRLSLQLWCPDQLPKQEDEAQKETDEPAVDPLASPPQDAVDAQGNLLDSSEISNLSLDGSAEVKHLFSQKNLIRLASLNNSHRTLSLFTPGIRDVVFRAWAGSTERHETGSTSPLATPSLARSQSFQGSTTYSFSDTGSMDHGHLPSRPSLVSLNSATTGLSLGAGRHSRSHSSRKKKTRVVNLRKNKTESAPVSDVDETETVSDSTSIRGPMSEPIMPASIPEEPEEEVPVPPTPSKVRFKAAGERPSMPPRSPLTSEVYNAPSALFTSAKSETPAEAPVVASRPQEKSEKASEKMPMHFESRRGPSSETSSVILEQAWIMKMAGEIARRVYDEKRRNPGLWDEREDSPPPAYEAR